MTKLLCHSSKLTALSPTIIWADSFRRRQVC
jgi:hypothetical protein